MKRSKGIGVAREQPNLQSYRHQLEEISARLTGAAQSTKILGSGIALFLNAHNGNWAVNLSWDDEGVFLELWEGDENVRDYFEPTWDAAVHAACRWLNNGGNPA